MTGASTGHFDEGNPSDRSHNERGRGHGLGSGSRSGDSYDGSEYGSGAYRSGDRPQGPLYDPRGGNWQDYRSHPRGPAGNPPTPTPGFAPASNAMADRVRLLEDIDRRGQAARREDRLNSERELRMRKEYKRAQEEEGLVREEEDRELERKERELEIEELKLEEMRSELEKKKLNVKERRKNKKEEFVRQERVIAEEHVRREQAYERRSKAESSHRVRDVLAAYEIGRAYRREQESRARSPQSPRRSYGMDYRDRRDLPYIEARSRSKSQQSRHHVQKKYEHRQLQSQPAILQGDESRPVSVFKSPYIREYPHQTLSYNSNTLQTKKDLYKARRQNKDAQKLLAAAITMEK